jgi:hypothetical protein
VIKSRSQKRTFFDLQESVRLLFGATDATRVRVVLQLVAFPFFSAHNIHFVIAPARVSGSSKQWIRAKQSRWEGRGCY